MLLREERDVNAIEASRKLLLKELKPDESRRILSYGFEIPPLELLHDPKCEAFIRDLPPEGQELTLRVRVHSVVRASGGGDKEDFITVVEKKFTLTPRNETETALNESWYDATPPEQFLTIDPKSDYPVKWVRWSKSSTPFYVGYPGSVYAEKTWQQWKELKDSLESSTLRDNVRKVRFVMQYKATHDAQVLAEFRTWLTNLPPLQRGNMIYGYPLYPFSHNDPDLKAILEAIVDLR